MKSIMSELFKSFDAMTTLWVGCIVMGLFYLFFLWDGHGSTAFIVGQVVLGMVGIIRERYIQAHYTRKA